MKIIINIFLIVTTSFSTEIGELREQRLQATYSHYGDNEDTEVRGISAENITETENGTLIISNERVYGEDVSIKAGKNIHKVIIRNLKIRTNGRNQIIEGSSTSALNIDTDDNTKLAINDVFIDTDSDTRAIESSKSKVCAGALCIQSGKNSEINIDSLSISTSDSHYSAISDSKINGKVCAGALCIQSDDSDIEINDYLSESDNQNLYRANK